MLADLSVITWTSMCQRVVCCLFFFLLFPVFVQIKTNQKKRVLWVNSNTWGVERNQVIPCFKGLCEWL